MPRRVFLDANVIIECFRIGVWSELSHTHWLETVQECEREALTGENSQAGRVQVDPVQLRAGLKASHLVSRAERNALIAQHPECLHMDAGEKDLFAHLFVNESPMPQPHLLVISSADKGAIVRANNLNWLMHLVSLENLLRTCGVNGPKMTLLGRQYEQAFLSKVRTDVMMGVIP